MNVGPFKSCWDYWMALGVAGMSSSLIVARRRRRSRDRLMEMAAKDCTVSVTVDMIRMIPNSRGSCSFEYAFWTPGMIGVNFTDRLFLVELYDAIRRGAIDRKAK